MEIMLRDYYPEEPGPQVLDLKIHGKDPRMLIGYAMKLAKILGFDEKAIFDEMIEELTVSRDPEKLLSIIKKHFGNYIILIDDPVE